MTLARLEDKGDRLVVVNANVTRRGALSPDLYEAIGEAVARADDPRIRAVILTAEGGFFCAGGDLNVLIERRNLSEAERRGKVDLLHDLVRGIRLLIDAVPERPEDGIVPDGDSLSPVAPWRVVNIGNSQSVRLLDFVEAIETALGKTAHRNMMEMQKGDVPATWADATLLHRLTGYRPQTELQTGVQRFVDWYRDYYRV